MVDFLWELCIMKTLQETTKWEYANHTYIVSDDKFQVYGYIKLGDTEPTMFSKPMNFDTRRRTFKQLK